MKIFTMTKTVAKNLVQGPATLMHPKRQRSFPERTRGRIENDIGRCIFCGACSRRCPTSAIVVTKEKREWQIDRLRCCICNLCVDICPVKSLSTETRYPAPVTEREMALNLKSAQSPAEATVRGEL